MDSWFVLGRAVDYTAGGGVFIPEAVWSALEGNAVLILE